ncbi:hypothetical protein [uncultured Brachyspira sp.]|uniref:hypothetical protein n=1 Tax=uncultured Brachyspira sp. TaxID=221953 RepID=UPI0025CCA40B|nr:hypothetical protein [uncultured Brachyspira sp.]
MNIAGFNTGLALKFILTPNININQDIVFGISSGAKFIPFIDDFNVKPSRIPISIYANILCGRRIYTINEKNALIVGFNVFYEYMFFNKNDVSKLFAGRNISQHHSLGALLSIGYHFGER